MESGVTAPEGLVLKANGRMANNPVLPMLIYRAAVEAGDPASTEEVFLGSRRLFMLREDQMSAKE